MNINDALAKEYNRGLADGKDSVEQKHGHFVQNEFISTLGMCSVCEHPIDDGDNFCKWCGAKMDGDSE